MILDKYSPQQGLKPRYRGKSCHAQPLNAGTGVAIGHHGEVLQGAVEHPLNGTRRFLVTLPWAGINSYAKFVLARNCDLVVEPVWKLKSRQAASLTLAYFGIEGFGGRLEIHSDALPELGFGSSTSDVVATIRAVACAFQRSLKPYEISSIAVKAELACDPSMYGEQAVVYLQREGIVMEHLCKQLPPAYVVGFNSTGAERGVSTLALPLPEYELEELEVFRFLLEDLRKAVSLQSIQVVGKVATASARINQRILPKPNFDALVEIQNETGACGLQVAHSGNIAGFLYDPYDINLKKRLFKVRHLLIELGIEDTWHFNTTW